MERIKEAIKAHKRELLLGTALTGVAALTYYGYRTYKLRAITSLRDPYFHTPNLPLYHKEAIARDRILRNVNYELFLSLLPLKGGRESQECCFDGKVNIQFYINSESGVTRQEVRDDLFIDFHGEEIQEVSINGERVPLKDVSFSKHRIHIGQHYLHPDAINTVSVKFLNSYVNNSAGLHRFQDPKDNEIYIYSHLEPFNCHRWFPCFDQPSIRAPLKLSVIVPDPSWEVVGNGAL
jgi:aminopeptidase N